MNEKNELSDIILDRDSAKKGRAKRILLIVIILIILFLLAIAGVKFFNKSKTKKSSFNVIVPPATSKKVSKQDNEKDELFKQVPIIEENSNKNSFYKMIEDLKKKEKAKDTVQPSPITPTVPAKTKINTPKPIPQKAVLSNSKTTKNKPTKNKKIAVPQKSKKASKSNKKVKRQKITRQTGNVYIQVGVTFKTKPDKKYLHKISKAGYNYKIYTLNISGKKATKILVGPYRTKYEARKSMPKIKREINKAAFIYVIK